MGNCLSPRIRCCECGIRQKKYQIFSWEQRAYCSNCVPNVYFHQDKVPLMDPLDPKTSGRYMF